VKSLYCLRFVHSCDGHDVGQNAFFSSKRFRPADATNSWAGERNNWNFTSHSCTPGTMCGHWTQVSATITAPNSTYFDLSSMFCTTDIATVRTTHFWLATLHAKSDPYRYTACLWLCPSVCPQHGLCWHSVRAALRSLQRREPRRLPACIVLSHGILYSIGTDDKLYGSTKSRNVSRCCTYNSVCSVCLGYYTADSKSKVK